MVTHEEDIQALKKVGGRLCLDFCNTIDWHEEVEAPREPRDWLNTYSDLLAWAEHVGMLEEREAENLRQQAAVRPGEAERVFEDAIGLRESLYHLFSAVAAGLAPPESALERVNEALSRGLCYRRVAVSEDRFVWEWGGGEESLGRVLWPIALSAATLLTSDELERVRECDGMHCGWLFIDTSRNRSRRWCDMQACGNVAKVRRYRKRQRAST